jgi:hypothetical protein
MLKAPRVVCAPAIKDPAIRMAVAAARVTVTFRINLLLVFQSDSTAPLRTHGGKNSSELFLTVDGPVRVAAGLSFSQRLPATQCPGWRGDMLRPAVDLSQ